MLGVIDFHAYPRLGPISPHGLGIAAGYLVGGMLMARHAARRGISADDVWNMLMRAVVGVIVGARIFYVMGHLDEYFGAGRSPIDILKVWEGGVVFYGGVFGGIIAAIPYMRSHGLSFRAVLDSAAPAFPLGLIFGRIGDIIVGDHLGGASTLPFAFRFAPYEVPPDTREWVAHAFQSEGDRVACFTSGCHQTALYDLVNVIVLFAVVMWLARKPRAKGFLIAFTATWYGGARLITDFARDAEYYFGLHGTQWASITLIVVGTWYLVRLAKHGERDVWVEPDAPGAGAAAAITAAVGSVAGPDAATAAAGGADAIVTATTAPPATMDPDPSDFHASDLHTSDPEPSEPLPGDEDPGSDDRPPAQA